MPKVAPPILWACALVLMTVVVYLPATRAGFVWDDDYYVTRNPTLGDLRGLGRIWAEPGAVPQYYPLVHTTFWIERHLWGFDPFGYHLVNILLHAFGSLLLWFLLRRLRIPGAWLAAAVFALHPIQVESVAWVTERKNVLSGVFYMAALLAWFRFSPWEKDVADSGGARRSDAAAASGLPERRKPRTGEWRFYGLALVLFVCALLSKTVSGSLPAAILLILWWKRGRISPGEIVSLLPFFALAAGMGGLTLWMEKRHVGAQGAMWDFSLPERILIAGRALWFYTAKLLLPANLSFVYSRWQVDEWDLRQYLYPAAALAVGLGLWFQRARLGRAPLAAALLFAGTLFPALGFFNVYPMLYSFVADHFAYLACAGPIALACGLAATSAERLFGNRLHSAARLDGSHPDLLVSPSRDLRSPGRPGGRSSTYSRAGPGALLFANATVRLPGALLLLFLGILTWQRAAVYRDPEVLWLDTLKKNPDAWMARHNLGKFYEDQGKAERAMEQYRLALEIRPDLDNTLYNLANILASRGRIEEAIQEYRAALRCNPTMVEAMNNLGNALYKQGRSEEAIAAYDRALALDTGYAAAHRNLAFALVEEGRTGQAVEHLRRAVQLDPSDLRTANRLAWLLATSEDPSARDGSTAMRLASKACAATGNRNAPYLATLAAAYAETGRFDLAVGAIHQALEIAAAGGREDMKAAYTAHLELYRARRPLRVPK